MEKVTMIKKDALIKLDVGVGFLQALQTATVYLSSQQTEEELKLFEQEAQTITHPNNFSQPWMTTLYCITNLVYAIEQAALDQGVTYEEDQDVTRLDDLSALQSESQP